MSCGTTKLFVIPWYERRPGESPEYCGHSVHRTHADIREYIYRGASRVMPCTERGRVMVYSLTLPENSPYIPQAKNGAKNGSAYFETDETLYDLLVGLKPELLDLLDAPNAATASAKAQTPKARQPLVTTIVLHANPTKPLYLQLPAHGQRFVASPALG